MSKPWSAFSRSNLRFRMSGVAQRRIDMVLSSQAWEMFVRIIERVFPPRMWAPHELSEGVDRLTEQQESEIRAIRILRGFAATKAWGFSSHFPFRLENEADAFSFPVSPLRGGSAACALSQRSKQPASNNRASTAHHVERRGLAPRSAPTARSVCDSGKAQSAAKGMRPRANVADSGFSISCPCRAPRRAEPDR